MLRKSSALAPLRSCRDVHILILFKGFASSKINLIHYSANTQTGIGQMPVFLLQTGSKRNFSNISVFERFDFYTKKVGLEGVRNVSAKVRRAELIRILRYRRKDTVGNLAYELGVSVSTINRDILVLTVDEGHLIDTARGNGGGVIYQGQVHPHKGVLSQEEIQALKEAAEILGGSHADVFHRMLKSYA